MKASDSINMLGRCNLYSEIRKTEVSLSEPDNQLVDAIISFAQVINPYDWGNDDHLLHLVDAVFNRKETEKDG